MSKPNNKAKGWRGDPYGHSLASRGIEVKRKPSLQKKFEEMKQKEREFRELEEELEKAAREAS